MVVGSKEKDNEILKRCLSKSRKEENDKKMFQLKELMAYHLIFGDFSFLLNKTIYKLIKALLLPLLLCKILL